MFPRYLAVLADFNSILCSFYAYITEFFFLDTVITSHLSWLNSVDQFDSHSSSLCRSDCNVSETGGELLVIR